MILPKCIQIKEEIPVFCHKSAGAAVKIHQISNHLCLNSFHSQQDDKKNYFTIGSLGGEKKKALLITGIYSNKYSREELKHTVNKSSIILSFPCDLIMQLYLSYFIYLILFIFSFWISPTRKMRNRKKQS